MTTAAICQTCRRPIADEARNATDFVAPGPSPADFCFARLNGRECGRQSHAAVVADLKQARADLARVLRENDTLCDQIAVLESRLSASEADAARLRKALETVLETTADPERGAYHTDAMHARARAVDALRGRGTPPADETASPDATIAMLARGDLSRLAKAENETASLRAQVERLTDLARSAAADIRHGLARPASAGVIADVCARLERASTPNAPGSEIPPAAPKPDAAAQVKPVDPSKPERGQQPRVVMEHIASVKAAAPKPTCATCWATDGHAWGCPEMPAPTPAAPKPDFLDEVVADRTTKNPAFPAMVAEAEKRRAPKPDAEAKWKCQACRAPLSSDPMGTAGLCGACSGVAASTPAEAKCRLARGHVSPCDPSASPHGYLQCGRPVTSPTPAAPDVSGWETVDHLRSRIGDYEAEVEELRSIRETDIEREQVLLRERNALRAEVERLKALAEVRQKKLDALHEEHGRCNWPPVEKSLRAELDKAKAERRKVYDNLLIAVERAKKAETERDAIAEKVRDECVALLRAEDECGRNSGVGARLESLAQRMETLSLTAEVKPESESLISALASEPTGTGEGVTAWDVEKAEVKP